MNHYKLGDMTVDAVELKCLVVSKGAKVDKAVYRSFGKDYRIGVNPLMCNCMFLSDGTVAQMTDVGFHLEYLSGILSIDKLKMLRYASDMETPFVVRVIDDKPALLYRNAFVDFVSFPEQSPFYRMKTPGGMPFIGNAVLQGVDWVAFQSLWPCEFAACGAPCQFCFSGAETEARVRRGKQSLGPLPAGDAAYIVDFAVNTHTPYANSVQITGGSTRDATREAALVKGYLEAINARVGDKLTGEMLLYLTPPSATGVIDDYFGLGADRVAFSLELWDEARAAEVTPGKLANGGRKRHLDMLEYAANTYGAAKAFSNFIIGIEPFETLKEGATYLAERGVMPTASVWMPMGRPVMGSARPPEADYFRRVKELFAELYTRFGLEPPKGRGLNVCIERDIWNYATQGL